MKLNFLILLFLTNLSFAQTESDFLTDFILEAELHKENKLTKYQQFDFSGLWTNMPNNIVYGIIGNEHQRIRIKFLSILKSFQKPSVYIVQGKSMVKENICEFVGKIKLKEIRETKKLHYGVDEEYKNRGIEKQGIIIADYHFNESLDQRLSGTFSGKLYSKWYLDSECNIFYDDIRIMADGYYNNAFVGVWESHKTGKVKICNWADCRVPNANKDFDIGTGEFSVSEKYWSKGWLDIALTNQIPNGVIIKTELNNVIHKEWWE